MTPRIARALGMAGTCVLVVLMTLSAPAQSTYPRAGWETHLTVLAHGVTGTATIVDERTIRLTHFRYDGAAPDMFVYVGTNLSSAAFINGLQVSPRLTRAYTNETYVVQLPVGQTLDGWNSISIWCRIVQGSFGWGTFAPPNRPTLTATPRPAGLELKLSGEAGQKYWLQASTNLVDTNSWQSLALLTNVSGTVLYTNSAANPPLRFFRAVRD